MLIDPLERAWVQCRTVGAFRMAEALIESISVWDHLPANDTIFLRISTRFMNLLVLASPHVLER